MLALHAICELYGDKIVRTGNERDLMMGKALTKHQLGEYQHQGFLFPLPILSESETAALRRKLEDLEINQGGRLPALINRKPHLLLTWLNALIRDPRILDPVEDILGPNILCWGSGFFIKNAHDPARVTWHQDSTYWGLSKPDIVTAWVAFTPSTPENGCVRVVPGNASAPAASAPGYLCAKQPSEPRPGDCRRSR